MYFTWCWSGPHHTFPSTNARDIIESKTSTSKKNSQLIGSLKMADGHSPSVQLIKDGGYCLIRFCALDNSVNIIYLS